ncbi:MAG: M15 family metallopeptidase [Cellulosilyticaceae bacterium]
MKSKQFLIALSLITLLPTMSFATTPTYIKKECPNNNPYHILVNKQQHVTRDFMPSNLVVPNVKFSFTGYHEKKNLEQTAALALESLFSAAKKDGITLAAVSGYRSYDRQAQLYNNYVKKDGQAKADTYSARPGTSEHQTGLSIDVSAPSVGYELTNRLGETKEGKWLAAHAHEHGFVIRYPKDKVSITGYIYEPWHIRYVGSELAQNLYINKLTLEELETCCEKEVPLTPLTPATITPIIPPEAQALLKNPIEFWIDKRLQDLQIIVSEEAGHYKVLIQPSDS